LLFPSNSHHWDARPPRRAIHAKKVLTPRQHGEDSHIISIGCGCVTLITWLWPGDGRQSSAAVDRTAQGSAQPAFTNPLRPGFDNLTKTGGVRMAEGGTTWSDFFLSLHSF
jgi:hypothetical protein